MRRSRQSLLDHFFNVICVLFTLWFIAIGQHQGWSTLLTIGLLVIVSIPIALALLWLKLWLRLYFETSANAHCQHFRTRPTVHHCGHSFINALCSYGARDSRGISDW